MKAGFFTAALAASLLVAGSATALDQVPTLSLDVAKRMVDGCEAKAAQEGWRMNIAVVDRGANLVVFRRMDNAFLGSVDIAIGKARTSARFPFPSRFMGELAYGKEGKPGAVPGIAEVDGIMAFPGGLPVKAGDAHIGGIGVSGATGDQDEMCAQAGIDAVKADLN